MQAFYVNVAAEEQPQDIQVVRSTVAAYEEPLDEVYDVRRAIATTICERVLSKYNLDHVTVTLDGGTGLFIKLAPLPTEDTWHVSEEDTEYAPADD